MATVNVPLNNKKAIEFLDKVIANKEALMAATHAKIAEKKAKAKREKMLVANG